jgi:hypothetical protein
MNIPIEWVGLALPGLVIFVVLSALEARYMYMYQGKHRLGNLEYRNRQYSA